MDLNDDDDVDEEKRRGRELFLNFSSSHHNNIQHHKSNNNNKNTQIMIRFATTSSLFSASDKSVFSLSSSPHIIRNEKTTREREWLMCGLCLSICLSLLWCMCVYVVWCLDRNLYHHIVLVVCVYNNRPRDINYIHARSRNNSSIFE